MRSLTIFALMTFLSAVPAAPIPREVKHFQKIEGTTWSGDGVVAPTVYTFEKGGVLTFSYNGTTHNTGSWKEDGNVVYWETCNKYCEFDGTFTNTEMSGKAHNVTNGKWDLKMKKVK